ncbi:MAG: 50S ribosomal protein L9 [Candidatus Pacebacteria bacterium]|nr:50S ribosomal protein L9 [Candidatus Paceibacterota bacterium]
MKIYLLQDIPSLGKKGEIKNVADGYALNYLFPKKMASRADKKIVEKVSQEQKHKAIERQKQREKDLKLAEGLKNFVLEIPLKFAQKGKKAYDSVNSKKIMEELKQKGIEIKENQIQLKNPLKEEGDYEVKLTLDKDIETILKIKIVSSADFKN